jgi:hypothetical protein
MATGSGNEAIAFARASKASEQLSQFGAAQAGAFSMRHG